MALKGVPDDVAREIVSVLDADATARRQVEADRTGAAAPPSRPVRSLQSSCARESERDEQLADVRKPASRWKTRKPLGLSRLQLERSAGMRGAGQG